MLWCYYMLYIPMHSFPLFAFPFSLFTRLLRSLSLFLLLILSFFKCPFVRCGCLFQFPTKVLARTFLFRSLVHLQFVWTFAISMNLNSFCCFNWFRQIPSYNIHAYWMAKLAHLSNAIKMKCSPSLSRTRSLSLSVCSHFLYFCPRFVLLQFNIIKAQANELFINQRDIHHILQSKSETIDSVCRFSSSASSSSVDHFLFSLTALLHL